MTMIRKLATGLFFGGVLIVTATARTAVNLELDLDAVNQAEPRALQGGVTEIRTTGGDPFILCKQTSGSYDPDKHFMLSFEYFCAKGLDFVELFYGPPIIAQQAAQGPPVISSEGWTSYAFDIREKQRPGSWKKGYTLFRLDFGAKPDRIIQIRNIQLREPTTYELKLAQEREAQKDARKEFDDRLRKVLAQDFATTIDRVTVEVEAITFQITTTSSIDDLWLCEVPFYQTHIAREDFVWKQPLRAAKNTATTPFSVRIPRIRTEGKGTHDRLCSSWVVMQHTGSRWLPASRQRFPDTVPPKWQLSRDLPISKKGTTGMHGGNQFQFDDYKALGIHNCTKNIVLNSIIGVKPDENTFPHSFNGRTYHIRPGATNRLDRAMREMDELDIVVSAIILISKNTPMTHPDCAPQGIWAMPNVVEKNGWNYYAAGLDFLAQRYSDPDRKYGRITHWIMHNEVDAGWVWTNAGEKPLHTYLDLYYRSMRTAQCTIRKYGTAGNVLMSLTHYWTKAHNHLCYHPKDMIDLLQQRSSLEGDFDWGLAYHPYPQNLRDPRTWLDKAATFSFMTPHITPRNLEVLDAYMRQPRMLYDGKPRTVVLSEQGSNSRDHSEKSHRDQAAGLVYTWLKFEKLDTIESYIHHRWMDVTPGGEGGLLLGFWTNLPDEEPRHRKKPAWDIYRMLGTDEQNEAVDYAKKTIPAKYLEDIPHTGLIE